jgi:hypothetical protein
LERRRARPGDPETVGVFDNAIFGLPQPSQEGPSVIALQQWQ